jgi:NAD-dependent deacetylase
MTWDPVGRIPADLAVRLREARRWFVLTGAGISAESGVPTFRGAGGLWEGSRPEELASLEGFRRDPARVWRWYRWRRSVVSGVEPNDGHRALARIEAARPAFCLATQNVDGLHHRAGSRRVLELHGNITRSRCLEDCGALVVENPSVEVPLCRCGAALRPDVVWFGESLNPVTLEEALAEADRSEICLVIGTSAVVYPAAMIPAAAARNGAVLVEINPEETPLSGSCHLRFRGRAAEVLPRLIGDILGDGEPGTPRGV